MHFFSPSLSLPNSAYSYTEHDCAGATLHHTLTALGAKDIDTWFVPKGENIHTTDATEALSALNAAALIVLDQGSRGGPPILPEVPTLILDHHQSTVFPDEAQASCCCMYRNVQQLLALYTISPSHTTKEQNS